MVLTMDRAARASLYERDFVKWTEGQAAELRRLATQSHVGSLDLLNLAEEIEGLGRGDRRQLASHVCTIIEHLMKLDASPAVQPRNLWRPSIREARAQIDRLLEHSPSLKADIGRMIKPETDRARQLVKGSLEDHGEVSKVPLGALEYTADQVRSRKFFGTTIP